MYVVYQHVNKNNGKRYIGITRQNPPSLRWGANGCNYKSSPHFYASIQKYGWDSFEHEVLFDNLTKEQACSLEIKLIDKYHTMDRRFGYNSTTGGESFVMSEESRIKTSKSMMNNKNGLGKPCSKEKAKKISDAQKGRKLTGEHKKKLSEAAKKRHAPCSETKKEKLKHSHPHAKKVYCKETDTIYESVQECARQLGLWATSVSKVCRGVFESTDGYHLSYYNDTINA